MAQRMRPISEGEPRVEHTHSEGITMGADAVSALPWKRVSSSNIHSLAWGLDGHLYVRFTGAEKGGKVYRYEAGRDAYDDLMEADGDPGRSVGSTFHNTVKQGEVPFARVHISDPDYGPQEGAERGSSDD